MTDKPVTDKPVTEKPVTDKPGPQPAPPTDERPPKPRPAPVPDTDTAEYWGAARDGRLLIQRCTSCQKAQLYPRDRCRRCRGEVEWEEASGRATVYSFTVIRQNYQRPFRDWIPYVVALVDLEEGPRIMTNVVGCDPDLVHIGMPVRARFEAVSDDAGIALFEPSR
ncbi:MAG TPA: Zn-ribbon domain-containing OB-fold protein [Acidimicrobiales bacterium]|nr:Zn-ribbon domain-containing OB-fold protein [Acidimicrobiales bacterium]